MFAAHVSTRIAGRDAIDSIEAAIESAEALLGHSLLDDCTDHTTGEITPVIIASDNGAAHKSSDLGCW